MKVEIFVPVSYYGPVDKTWPTPPRCYDPQLGMRSMECGMQQCEAAYAAGFDSLNFAEHHYSVNQLSPSPIFYAGILGQRLPDAQIALLGSDLPLHNPVQLAEEYSMLDNLLAGRLRIGLLRGTPNEYLTYGTNPWESKESFKEAVRLFIRALTEPEPFGWEGRYYRYRNVAIWPQPLQRPHPRILLSGNSPDSAAFAGEVGADIGFSFMPPEKCAANLEHYRDAARAAGWEPTADNILYRQFCFVGETDEKANVGRADLSGLFASSSVDVMMTMALAGAAMGGLPKGVPLDPSKAPPMHFSPGWFGTPEQVLDSIRETHEVVGMGRVEFIVGGTPACPHEAVVESLALMGETIVPALHADRFALAVA
jgi:alkanesulfonate monooxygenase SsuD/methylene tetrahydromethanopterin reductase-like flavin-dependent oxidoreductase (luciferase family)